jgi:hypothetical protein
MQLHFTPDVVGQVFGVVLVFQDVDALFNTVIVEADPFACLILRDAPVTGLEVPARGLAALAKQAIVPVEAIEDGSRRIWDESSFGKTCMAGPV